MDSSPSTPAASDAPPSGSQASARPTSDAVLYGAPEAGVVTITVNRPERLNALSAEVIDGLDAAFARAHADADVRAIVLTGAGPKAFVAGADIRGFAGLTASEGEAFARRGQAVFSRIEGGTPVIAAVNGFALGGGCELALACHVRIAAANAVFGQPEVNLGLVPGYGGTQRLPRVVGRGIALEMILTGATVSAERAREIGLVSRVVAPEALLDAATETARLIASKAPLAVAYSVDAVLAADLPLGEGLAHEAALFGRAVDTDDAREGTEAFLARRPATFTGR